MISRVKSRIKKSFNFCRRKFKFKANKFSLSTYNFKVSLRTSFDFFSSLHRHCKFKRFYMTKRIRVEILKFQHEHQRHFSRFYLLYSSAASFSSFLFFVTRDEKKTTLSLILCLIKSR